ncbi:hypothetical protein PG984_000346 [Apiospora sp. TS-2023a]
MYQQATSFQPIRCFPEPTCQASDQVMRTLRHPQIVGTARRHPYPGPRSIWGESPILDCPRQALQLCRMALCHREDVSFHNCHNMNFETRSDSWVEHPYPQDSHVKVHMDVKLLLQSLNREQTDVGQWLHVIGYITSFQKPSRKSLVPECWGVGIQALVLWKAEELDLAAYEASF